MIPREWTTFQGNKVSLSTIDHQHLSNVYWWLVIMYNVKPVDMLEIQEELDARFNGQLLPYRPHSGFTQEFKLLEQKGLLTMRERSPIAAYYDIVFNGTLIGEYVIPNERYSFLAKREVEEDLE